jgi:prepilin-type processing-associated H-X9-DG protein
MDGYISISGNGINSAAWYTAGALQNAWAQYGPSNWPAGGGQLYETGVFGNSGGVAGTPPFDQALGRHTGGANYVFADSHVKWLRPTAVSAGFNNTIAGAGTSGSGTRLIAANTGALSSTLAATFSID